MDGRQRPMTAAQEATLKRLAQARIHSETGGGELAAKILGGGGDDSQHLR
jgi:hypothetical protein